jgi:hypothetical protein
VSTRAARELKHAFAKQLNHTVAVEPSCYLDRQALTAEDAFPLGDVGDRMTRYRKGTSAAEGVATH